MAFERSQGTPAPGNKALPERAALVGLVLWIGFAVVAASVYSAAFTGPFISDDYGYIVSHPYVQQLDAESVREIFDPWGDARLFTGSYAPVHLLLTAVERSLFGDRTLGYHLANVGLHALAGVLLVAWLWQLGVGRAVSLGAGLVFLLHPANVEAVAWASQLGILVAMVCSLAALLCLRTVPGLATLFFLLGLLSHSSALAALPTAAALVWVSGAVDKRRLAGWLVGWLGLAAAYAVAMVAARAFLPVVDVEAFDERWVQLFSIVAVGMRYLAMAFSSAGVSAWHEPLPVRDPMDPWLLAGLASACLLIWRLVVMLRARKPEAVCWIAAAAAFLPVSQLFPLVTPMADRHLYFMLPGLFGGSLLALRALLARTGVDVHRLAPVLVAVGLAVVFVAGWRSTERVALWQSESDLLLDAALHYPQGMTASFVRARRAAQDGDTERAVHELRRATQQGFDRFMVLPQDPGLAPLREAPAFRALVRELAGRFIARARLRGDSTQPQLRVLGMAHMLREEYPQAIAAFEQALDAEGPLDELLRRELDAARLRLSAAPGELSSQS